MQRVQQLQRSLPRFLSFGVLSQEVVQLSASTPNPRHFQPQLRVVSVLRKEPVVELQGILEQFLADRFRLGDAGQPFVADTGQHAIDRFKRFAKTGLRPSGVFVGTLSGRSGVNRLPHRHRCARQQRHNHQPAREYRDFVFSSEFSQAIPRCRRASLNRLVIEVPLRVSMSSPLISACSGLMYSGVPRICEKAV